MAAKGYTTADNVATQLGRTLTEAQLAYLYSLVIPAVEQWIDAQGGRTYGDSAVVAEQLYMSGPVTWLSKTPVDSIAAVRGYYWNQTAGDMGVVNTNYYLLQDNRTGQLYIPTWQSFQHLEVDYIPDNAIPANITMAATILCCIFMRTVLHPQTEWLTEYASGQDARAKFRAIEIPQHVYDLVGTSGSGIVVA